MAHRHFSLVAAALVVAASLAACGTHSVAPLASPSPVQPSGQSSPTPHRFADQVIDAGLISPDHGWLRSGQTIFQTTDGGATWNRLPVPLSLWPGNAVSMTNSSSNASSNASGLVVAGQLADQDAVAQSSNNGQSWARMPFGPIPDVGRASVVTRGNETAVLLTTATSEQESDGSLLLTTDGTTWARTQAPAGGDVVLGTGDDLWLSGGVQFRSLFHSTDLGTTWSEIQLPLSDVTTGASMALSKPVLVDTTLVVPVTVIQPTGKAQLRFYVSNDGSAFSEAASTDLESSVGAGVRVPSAVLGAQTWIAADPDGSRIYVFDGSTTAQDHSPERAATG